MLNCAVHFYARNCSQLAFCACACRCKPPHQVPAASSLVFFVPIDSTNIDAVTVAAAADADAAPSLLLCRSLSSRRSTTWVHPVTGQMFKKRKAPQSARVGGGEGGDSGLGGFEGGDSRGASAAQTMPLRSQTAGGQRRNGSGGSSGSSVRQAWGQPTSADSDLG